MFIRIRQRPLRRAEITGDHHSQHAERQCLTSSSDPAYKSIRRFVRFQPLEQHKCILSRDHRSRRRHRHQVHRALARRQRQHHKLRDDPQAEKQQIPISLQLFTEVPQPQIHQDIPRQKRLRQLGEVVIKRLVMPGLNERSAEPSDTVGQQNLSHRLRTAMLIKHHQPDQQRNQTDHGEQSRPQPIPDLQAPVDQVVRQQISKNHHARHRQAEHTFTQRCDGNADDKQQRVAQRRQSLRLEKRQ